MPQINIRGSVEKQQTVQRKTRVVTPRKAQKLQVIAEPGWEMKARITKQEVRSLEKRESGR